MNKNTKTIVVMAVSTALMFALGAVPLIFLLPLLFVACTQKVWVSVVMGLIYGCVSLIYAFIMTTIIALAFISLPLIAIIPRIFVGLFACLAFKLTRKLIPNKGKISASVPYVVCAIVGVLTNTGLVVSALIIFAPTVALGEMTILLYVPTMLLGCIGEFIAMIFVMPAVGLTVSKALKMGEFAPQLLKNSQLADNTI